MVSSFVSLLIHVFNWWTTTTITHLSLHHTQSTSHYLNWSSYPILASQTEPSRLEILFRCALTGYNNNLTDQGQSYMPSSTSTIFICIDLHFAAHIKTTTSTTIHYYPIYTMKKRLHHIIYTYNGVLRSLLLAEKDSLADMFISAWAFYI